MMGIKLSNKWYDVLRFVVQIFLPAFGTLYTVLEALWNLPAVTEVVGTTAALAVFLGTLLGLSRRNYVESEDFSKDGNFDGVLVFDESNINNDPLSLHLDANSLGVLRDKDQVVLRVRHS